MKRKHKAYQRPKRPFNKERILDENKIREEFGLKNKKEIWKIESRVKTIKERAKELIPAKPEEQESFFARLRKLGFKVKSIPEVLSLSKIDYIKRRLQTILVDKKITTTPKGARQLITHKKVLVNGEVVSSPSYIVPLELEDKISLKRKNPKIQKKIENQEAEDSSNKIAEEISQ